MSFFDNAYEGTPTWEIGRPQGAVVRLAEAGLIVGAVLDLGCGTGDNALFLAGRGHEVVGIDFAGAAITKARVKAAERGVSATFLVGDALDPAVHPADPGRAFDTALDVGLFHSLQPEDRSRYAARVRAALRPSGRCLLLCWSDRNPFGYGPERVTRPAIRAAFRAGWTVEAIDEEILETRLPVGRVHAWLARLRRD
jgi:cyclopropane fatty-acyl-phospholipid synthase-like methyltransferase